MKEKEKRREEGEKREKRREREREREKRRKREMEERPEDLQPTCERDRRVCQWLAQNKRSAYIPCFLILQRDSPHVLVCVFSFLFLFLFFLFSCFVFCCFLLVSWFLFIFFFCF